MKIWIKRLAIAVAMLAGLFALAVAAAVLRGDARRNRQVELRPYALVVAADAASVARGRYLYESRGCADCHGANGGGRVVIDEGGMRVAGPNISPGPGNVVAAYRPEDWERTIRHGVKPDGRPLLIMPANEYNRLTDADLAAIVSYLRQLPPAPGGAAVLRLPLPVRALYGIGIVKDAAERIDHRLAPQAPVPEGENVEHGRYVANMCVGCHGDGLSGGRIPGAPPAWPAAANLTPGEGSAMARYVSAEQLIAMFRSGRRPDGTAVSRVMPFDALGKASEIDVRALFLYLKSLPPRRIGQY